MTKFTRGKYAGESIADIQKKDPAYVRDSYQTQSNVFSSDLSSEEVDQIKEQQWNEQRARDCY
jgi:hypothetical protein